MSFDLVARIAPLDPRDLVRPPARVHRIATAAAPDLSRAEDPQGWFDDMKPAEPLTFELPDEESEDAGAERFSAKYHAREEELRTSFPTRALALLLQVLHEAGAIFNASVDQHDGEIADGDRGPKGPRGEVPSYKLCSNEGWHVTRDEAAVMHDRLTSFLDRGPAIEAGGNRFELRVDAADPDDRNALQWLRQLAVFFAAAARLHCFEVW